MRLTAAATQTSLHWAIASGRFGKKKREPFLGRLSSGTVSPIRTTDWGTLKGPAEYGVPNKDDLKSQDLAHEPEALNIDGGLPALSPDQLQVGVI